MRGLDLRGGKRGGRRAVRWAVILVCAGVLAAGYFGRGVVAAQAAALPRRLDAALAGHYVPHYTARLDALAAENFALRTALGAAQPALRENDALRTLVGAERVAGGAVYTPARLTAWYGDRFALVCRGDAAAPRGTPVLDQYGRLAGLVTRTDRAGAAGGECIVHCAAVGCGNAALPCFAGAGNAVCGTPERRRGELYLTGLPRHSSLAAGDVVTTASGLWVGRLAEGPVAEAGGLSAAAMLCETAVAAGEVYFLAG